MEVFPYSDNLHWLCIKIWGYLCYFQRELEGYKFPVYTTEFCPRNEREWNNRSSEYNCKEESTYACFPNDNLTELVEFCYPMKIIAISRGKQIQRHYAYLQLTTEIAWTKFQTIHIC